MKKFLLYTCVAASVLGVASCNEDYDDWANPIVNSQDSINGSMSGVISAVNPTIKFADYASDATVALVKYASTNGNSNVTGASIKSLKVNGQQIPFTQENGQASVTVAALDSVVRVAYHSMACVERNLSLSAEATIGLANGESFVVNTNEVAVAYTPSDLIPASLKEVQSAYYYIGTYNNWTLASPTPMTPNGDGTFSVTLEVGDSEWFAFAPQSAVDNQDWNGLYRASSNGSTAKSDFFGLDPASGNSFQLETGGKYKFTIDPVNYWYSITEVHNELYLTGSQYNWGETWLPMVPCHSSDFDYWTIIYLHAGEQFKFAPQAGWGNDFGGQATINDVAGAGITVDATNLVCGNPGWYLLHIVNGTEQKLEVLKPEVYLMGSVAPVNDWSINADNLFTVPADENGEFVSPAFSADGEVRICVKFEGFDWWQTEFVAFDGKLAFRGRGDDQARVNVKAGEKAYINFAAGTCTFK